MVTTHQLSGSVLTDNSRDEELSIATGLKGIDIQLRSLTRLSILLRGATNPAAPKAMDALVDEVVKYFGSPQALELYQINEDFKGRKGLEEARANAKELGINDRYQVESDSEKGYLPDKDLIRFFKELGGREAPRDVSGGPKPVSGAGKIKQRFERRAPSGSSSSSRPSSPKRSQPISEHLAPRPRLLEQAGRHESLSDFGIRRAVSDSGRYHKTKEERPLHEYY
jgi:hypothetical protein